MDVGDEELRELLRSAAEAESGELREGLAALQAAGVDHTIRRAATALRVVDGVVVVPPGWRGLDEAAHQRIAARLAPAGSRLPAFVPATRRGWLWSLAGLAAASAGLALVLAGPAAGEPIPGYTLADRTTDLPSRLSFVRAGAGVRGPDTNPPFTVPDEIVVRPSVPVSGPLASAVYIRRGAVVSPWTGPVERAPSGSLQLLALRAELGREVPGEVELLVAVGRPSVLPADAQALVERKQEASPARGWVVLGLAIHIE